MSGGVAMSPDTQPNAPRVTQTQPRPPPDSVVLRWGSFLRGMAEIARIRSLAREIQNFTLCAICKLVRQVLSGFP
jgi:hypothetical protein